MDKELERYLETEEGQTFYNMGEAAAQVGKSLVLMTEAFSEGYAANMRLAGYFDKMTWRQRLAMWVVDISEKLTDWILKE